MIFIELGDGRVAKEKLGGISVQVVKDPSYGNSEQWETVRQGREVGTFNSYS